MTANEMKLALENQIDAIASDDAPAISDYAASDFLNQSNTLLLKKVMMQGIEFNEYNRQYVAGLKKNSSATISPSQEGVHLNGQFWNLPEDTYYITHERVVVDERDCFTGKLIEGDVFPVTEDYINNNRRNFEKMPYCTSAGNAALVWSLRHSSNTNNKLSELITDGTFGIVEYKLRYLSKPVTIVVDLENPDNQVNSDIYEEFHDDIINKAAIIALENMRMVSRFQSKEYLNKEQNL